ncbi:MAG: hypothetical protein ABI895_21225 [Deltaproteobacteria bacterium]
MSFLGYDQGAAFGGDVFPSPLEELAARGLALVEQASNFCVIEIKDVVQ